MPPDISRSLAVRLLREPLTHFLVLGALLFALGTLGRPAGPEPGAAGTGRNAVIVVSEDDLRQLSGLWRMQWGRDPTPGELRRLVNEQVREEVLVREALAAGLETQDILVRRRLAALGAAGLLQESAPTEPTEEELRALYGADPAAFAPMAELTVRQIAFSDRARGGRAKEEAISARDALAGRDAAAGAVLGDQSELPDRLEAQTPAEVAALFGEPFAAALAGLPAGSWQGPLPSLGSWHLVFIEQATPGPVPSYEEARAAVAQAWRQQRDEQEQQRAYAALLARYTVVLPPALAGGQP
jgi:hypothetical protein